ncbi:MAG: DUF4176 domain-containing protein [Bacillota bacterium]|nr:DUF4176 domain-containing protein [Bacillota bacterium]
MFTGLLPIGSVVLLKESTKKVMIIGFVQKQVKEDRSEVIWDYSGCLYPEGYLGPNQTILFNGDQIDRVYAVGYQDEEQFAFKVKIDAILEEIRTNGIPGSNT